MTFIPGRDFIQIAWIVTDLEEAVARWQATTGVGPFYIIPHARMENVVYRGRSAELDISAALAQAGPVQIELIQQFNDAPSAYRDAVPAGREGLHHYCTFTRDLDADLRAQVEQGRTVVASGTFGDTRFAYVDTRSSLGCMTEYLEDRASIRPIFKEVADAAIGWDGKDPVRYF